MNITRLLENYANNNVFDQKHPYKPHIHKESKAIIIGSAPPDRFCKDNLEDLNDRDVHYYYGSYHNGQYNNFWSVLFTVFEPNRLSELNAIRALENNRNEDTIKQQRRFFEQFLDRQKLGIMDLYRLFYRIGGSAKDEDLYPKEYQTITYFLNNSPLVERIYTTSKFVTDNLRMYFAGKEKEVIVHFGNVEVRATDNEVSLREIEVITLPSPVGRGYKGDRETILSELVKEYSSLMENDLPGSGYNDTLRLTIVVDMSVDKSTPPA